MSTRLKQILSTVAVGILTVCEAVGLYMRINMTAAPDIYIFYTENSNMFSFAVGLIFTVISIISIIRKKPVPEFLHILRYMVTVCLVITFLVVVFILTPSAAVMKNGEGEMMGFLGAAKIMMGSGAMFFEHFFCPVLSLFSFILFENGKSLKKNSILISLIPTFIYAGIFIPLNILKVVHGPYPFLYVYEQPVWMSFVWFVIIFGLAFGISAGIRGLHNIPFRKK